MKDTHQSGNVPHVVTARKYRPRVFGEIVGQSHIATTLRNAISTGRLSHAYLFSGPRGVGKTTTARILARAINCLRPREADPDNTCEICVEITEGRSLNVFEIDGASNRGVEEIRNLREAVRYGPAKGKYKVYIIDEVHMLTKEAFNALLKTLEEPPPHIVFIFATTEVHRVPATILSRCQRFEFRRISTPDIVSTLASIAEKEKIDIDRATLELIARRADGSLRDSQSIFDQVVSFCEGEIRVDDVRSLLKIVDDEYYFAVTAAISARDSAEGFRIAGEIAAAGYDLREFMAGLTEHLRNLLVVRTMQSGALVEGSEQVKKRYEETAHRYSEADLLRLLKLSSDTEAAMKWSQQPRVRMELGLMLMINMEGSVRIETLLTGIDELKKSLGTGAGRGKEPGMTSAPYRGTPRPEKEPADGSLRVPTPVRGAVKATQPTLRPDQYVVSPPPPGVPFPAGPASGPDAAKNWHLLVERARAEKIGVGTILAGTTFLSAEGNSLNIACPDDFHIDSLKRNRQYISNLAERIYGARIRLETVLNADGGAGNGRGNTAASRVGGKDEGDGGKRNAPAGGEDLLHHPVVQAVISEFGAEVVE